MKNKKIFSMLLLMVLVLLLTGCTATQKKQAKEYFDNGDFKSAREIYVELGMNEEISKCTYQIAKSLLEQKDYEAAIEEISTVLDYDGAKELLGQIHYEYASSLLVSGDYTHALEQVGQALNYNGSKELSDDITYQYAVSLYKDRKYRDAITQLEKIPNFNGVDELLDKCRVELKYAKFKYKTFSTEADNPDAVRTKKEVRECMESMLESWYMTWYPYDDQTDKEIVFDKYLLDGKEYGMISYDTNGINTIFEFYYQDDPTNVRRMYVSPDFTFLPVSDKNIYIFDVDGIPYYNVSNEEGETLLAALDEYNASQPLATKEQVYARAQEDLKAETYKGMDIFQAFGTAVSITWTFQDVNNIQYSYEPSTKVHTLAFYVYLSEYGLKSLGSQRFMVQYYEDGGGNLTLKDQIYRVDD